MRGHALLTAAVLLLAATASAQTAPEPSVGQIAFANSGSPQAQAAFQRGVALLHNFEYPRAITAFQEAQKADPGFAMAYWGEAMAHNHAVWMEQDPEKARAALARLGATPAERLAKARPARARGFLEAVEALYGDGTKKERDHAYSRRMEALFRAFPQDIDVASFYALSLLGLAHDGRDYGLYMRAAAILEEFFPSHSRHPGVLHYLIHSYDDPAHAPLGLRAARLYGAVAPDAPHAIHMTSHIFIAMGDWPQTIAANEAGMAAITKLRSAEGKPPPACGHGVEWLNYAYYQVGQPQRSQAAQLACHGAAAKALAENQPAASQMPIRSYADMWIRSLIEGDGRTVGAPLRVGPANFPDSAFTFAYGTLLQARGKPTQLAAARARLKQSAAATKRVEAHPLTLKRQEIILAQAEGLEAIAAGRRAPGLAMLSKAAELERVMAPDFGPPLVEKPSFELLAEELLAAGKPNEAAEAYRQALKLAPGRKLSTAGLRLAASRSPDASTSTAAASHTH